MNSIEREWKSKYESLEQDCAALTTTISSLESQLIVSKENLYNPTVVEDDFEDDIFGDIKVNGDDNIENIQQNIHDGENMENLNEKKNVQVENKQMEDLQTIVMKKNIDNIDNNDDNDDGTNESVKSESPEVEIYTSGDESSEQDSDSKMEQEVQNNNYNKNNCDSKQSDDNDDNNINDDIEEVYFPQSASKKCLMFRHREVIHLSKIQDCLQKTQEYIEALSTDDES